MEEALFKNGQKYLLHIIDCSKNNDENIFIDEEKYKGVTLTVDGYTLPENPKEWKQDKSNLNIYRTQIGDAEFTVTYKDKNLLTLEMKKGPEVKVVEPVGIKLSKYVYYHGESEILNDENDEKWIKKESFEKFSLDGFFTFDAEGTDDMSKSSFSRKPHIPKNKVKKLIEGAVDFGTDTNHEYYTAVEESGITIGRGFDLGSRNKLEIEKILNNTSKNWNCKPIDKSLKDWLVKAENLKKKAALEYLLNLNKISSNIITRKFQFFLFQEVFSDYIETAKRTMNNNMGDYKKISKEVFDVIVDMTYQGANNPNTRKKFISLLKKDIEEKKYDNFLKYLQDVYNEKKIQKNGYDRWERRINYIKSNKELYTNR